MAFDLTNDGHVQTIISEIYSPQNDEYRLAIDKQWRILRGDLNYFVEQHLKRIYPKTYSSFTPSEINLAKKITDKRSVAYKEEPMRLFDLESDTEAYEEALDLAQAKWVLRDFDTYYNYFKYSAIWFSFYEEDGAQKVKLRALRPNQFSRVVNDRDETEVFAVHLGNGGLDTAYQIRGDGLESNIQDEPEDTQEKRIALWTKDNHIVVRVQMTRGSVTKIMREPVEGNELMSNDMGMIPAVFLQEGSAQDLPAMNPLSNQTVDANFLLSTTITAGAAQSFGQLVVSHPEDQTIPDQMQQGLFTFMKLPQVGADSPATTADYISPSPDLTSLMEIYRNYVADVLEEHGVTGGEGVQGQNKFTSGLDRLLSEMDTTEIVEMNQESYAGKEGELFKLFREFYSLTGQYNFKSEDVTVIYKKPKPMQSEKELLEVIKQQMDLGLIEKWEALVKLNPNMSREEAEEKLERIEQEKLERMEMFLADKQEGSNEETQPFGAKSEVQDGEE